MQSTCPAYLTSSCQSKALMPGGQPQVYAHLVIRGGHAQLPCAAAQGCNQEGCYRNASLRIIA